MKAAATKQTTAPDTRGARLRRLRHERGLSQETVAHHCGVSMMFISLLERNHGDPSRDLLFRLSDFFGVSVHFIERGREFCYSDCFAAGATGPSPEVQS